MISVLIENWHRKKWKYFHLWQAFSLAMLAFIFGIQLNFLNLNPLFSCSLHIAGYYVADALLTQLLLLLICCYTHRRKLCFTQFSTRIYWNRSLTASDFFHIFTINYVIYFPLSNIQEYRYLKRVLHQIDRIRTVAPFSKF